MDPTLDESDWEHEVRARERRSQEAFLALDLGTLDELLADGYVVNSPLQRVVQKKELFDLLRAGRIRHSEYTSEIDQISRFGDVVLIMGQDRVVDPPDGAITLRRYTNIWQRKEGVWRAIGRQATAISRTVPAKPSLPASTKTG
jgi:hypothetical protein